MTLRFKPKDKKREGKEEKKTQNFNLKTKIYFGLLLQRSGFVLIKFQKKTPTTYDCCYLKKSIICSYFVSSS